MATKKDYILVANALHSSIPVERECEFSSGYGCGHCESCRKYEAENILFGRIVRSLCVEFKKDNERFDKSKFERAVVGKKI